MTSKTVNSRSGSSGPRTGSDCPLDTRLLMGGTHAFYLRLLGEGLGLDIGRLGIGGRCWIRCEPRSREKL